MRTTKRSILLILVASFLAGIGQLMWKKASFSLNLNFYSLLNFYLIFGILLYVAATFVMTLAFREGELSVLHPFLATSYIWVTLITPILFAGETMNIAKFTAVISIFCGVYLISLGGKAANG